MFAPRRSSKFPVAKKLVIVDTVTTSLPDFKDLSPVTTHLEYGMKSVDLGHFNAAFIGSMFKLDLDVLSVKMKFTDYTYYDAWTACVDSAVKAICAFLENVHQAEADVVIPDSVEVVYTYELQKRTGAKLFQAEFNVHQAEADVVIPDSVEVVYTYELQKRAGAKLFQAEFRQMVDSILETDKLKQKCSIFRSAWRPITLSVRFGYVDLTETLFTFPCNESELPTSLFDRE
uniref:Condensation domain-containing protein n=1 Tax=Panagrellus redivivus TaxID=6233 RepID=A0A7E4V723_PANRE